MWLFVWCQGLCYTGALSVCGASTQPSTSVRDPLVVLGSDFSLMCHVAPTVGQLRLIRSYIKSLPFEADMQSGCRRFPHHLRSPLQEAAGWRASVFPGRTSVGAEHRGEAYL